LLSHQDLRPERSIFCARKNDLSGRKSWCESNDPDFVAKAAEIVVSSMPPDGAIVLSGRRKAIDPGARTRARLPQIAELGAP